MHFRVKTSRFVWIVLALVTSLFSLIGWTNFPSTPPFRSHVIYKSVEGQDLWGDVFAPAAENSLSSGPRPAVLVVHGGSWAKRSGDMESLCRTLAENGFVAFNITYRLAPKNLFPKALDDVRDAARWLHDHSSEFNVDPNKIAGWGYSAGAHLVLMTGLDPSAGLKALVAGGTPADLTAWPDSPLIKIFLGVSFDEDPDLWRRASPVQHVSAESPPVFLYHGEWDRLVEVDQMFKMESALRKAGRPVETYMAPHLGHIATYFFSHEAIRRGIAFLRVNLGMPK